MIETDIHAALTAGSPSPTAAGDRVYALLRPQGGALPAVVYTRISNQPVTSLAGSSGLNRVRVQIDCWATTMAAALTLADEARVALEAATMKALPDSDFAEYEEETRIYRLSRDFFCWEK